MGKRILQLDGLRACAILAVFVHHALGVRMLWMGVDVFFVLSGFLITGILLDMRQVSFSAYITQFYDRRVRRILPPYILFLTVATVLFGSFWARHWYLYLGLTNYVFFYKDGYFPAMDALWSLGVEEQFYLVWPLIVFYFREKTLPYVLVGLLVAAPLFRGLATMFGSHLTIDLHWVTYMATPMRMDCMAMGALLTFAWRRYPEAIRRYGYLGLGVTALTPVIMVILSHRSGWSTIDGTIRGNVGTYEISLVAATGAFLWALGGRFTGVLTTGVMRYIGQISYSFYLIHMCCILLAQKYLHQPLVAAGVAFVGSMGYAALSWHYLETPILHGGNRKVAREEVSAAQPVEAPGRIA
jgi:peptidoglycan/LPS O-acetylase OafA/YrhL